MRIKQLTRNDEDALWELIGITVDSLENKEFWLPIDDEVRDHFFDPEWTIFYGAFDGPNLVGAWGLFLNEREYSESVAYMSMHFETPAKIDRLMVHPDYRGQNISVELFEYILEKARELGRKTLIATVHPKNTSGKGVLGKIGMDFQCAYLNKDGYFRNVYVMSTVKKKKGLFKRF